MAEHELLVLSRPPEGVSDAAYNDWYDTHVLEILALPGSPQPSASIARVRQRHHRAVAALYLFDALRDRRPVRGRLGGAPRRRRRWAHDLCRLVQPRGVAGLALHPIRDRVTADSEDA